LLGYDAASTDGNRVARNAALASALEWFGLAISLIASLSLLGWVLLRCRSGFDFTDEGFYLNWISNPRDFPGSVSQFGFVYHPLYRLVGRDVVLLRQCNVLIIFGLSCTLCTVLLRSICGDWANFSRAQCAGFLGVAVALASNSLAFFDVWIPTPGYNSLALQSLILATTAALVAKRELSKSSIAGWILVGIAGGVAFLAKPTTAAELGFLIFVYVIVAGKFILRGLLMALTGAILVMIVSAFVVDGSLVDFFQRYVDGLDAANRLTPSYSLKAIFRWDSFSLGRNQKFVFAALLVVTFLASSLAFLERGLARFGAISIVILASMLSIATSMGALSSGASHEPFQPKEFWAISAGVALAAMIFPTKTYRLLPRHSLALVAFLALLPHAYAFGTGAGLWESAANAGVFWLLIGVVVSAERAAVNAAWRQILPVAAVSLLVCTGALYSAMDRPYRQLESLRLQTDPVQINGGKSSLLLANETASYVRALDRLARENGFEGRNNMLDLTGNSPGSLYVIGARPLGQAWTLGGYLGSSDFVRAGIDRESCEAIGVSWILMEPNSPWHFVPNLLQPYGINISSDYLVVGSVSSSRYAPPEKFEQQLLKPARSLEIARQACEEAKRKSIAR
jgi:hypothetical protein